VPVPPPLRAAGRKNAPRVVAAAPPSAPEAPAATLARETAALRAVRIALRDHDAAAARAALAAYQREFPAGLLAEEAAALAVDTLCALGDDDAAARATAAFRSRYPASLHAARLERGCQGDATP
jgi:hypothetical protein